MSDRKKRTSLYAKIGISIINTIIYLIFNIAFYGFVIFAFMKASEGAYEFGMQVFGDVSVDEVPGHEMEFVIAEDDNLSKISNHLEEKELIKNQYSFWLRASLTVNDSNPIQPGIYRLNSAMNYETILDILTQRDEEALQE